MPRSRLKAQFTDDIKGKLEISYLRLEDLAPATRNARTHSSEQIAQIVASISAFGWTNPILIDEDRAIIAGHGRLEAAKAAGLADVPTITLAGLSAAQKRALAIADNKLALNAGWDDELLRLELGELGLEGFDLSLIGFSDLELKDILADRTEGLTDPDDVPEVQAEAVSALGDVWLLGRHRLVCGDSTDAGALDAALVGVKADLLLTDPPYGKLNIFAQGTVIGVEVAAKRRQYDPELYHGNANFELQPVLAAASGRYSLAVIWGGNYFADILPIRTSWLVWDKRAGERSYLSDCELAWSTLPIGARVKAIPWQGMIRAGPREERQHPTQKPADLMVWVLSDLAPAAREVLELFSGSGTTIIAAEMTGRACHAIEISPQYVDVAVRRWQSFTGQTATLESDGRTFAEIETERRLVDAA